MTTGARVLELLALLQSRRHWPGEELARRLEVSPRTLRRDVDALQELGYPVETTRGTGGGYHLAPGGSLPPLVLTEEEAAAAVLGLQHIAGNGAYPTMADAAMGTISKIVQVLPDRLRRRIDSLAAMTAAPSPDRRPMITDVAALTTLALACRDAETIQFSYRSRSGEESERLVQPHRLVNFEGAFYLVAWDLRRGDWRTFRVDRLSGPATTGRPFAPRPLPFDDAAEYLRVQLRHMPTRFRVRATVGAGAATVGPKVERWAEVTPMDEHRCQVTIPTSHLEWVPFLLCSTEAPFTVHEPPEAVDYIRDWGRRCLDATSPDAHA